MISLDDKYLGPFYRFEGTRNLNGVFGPCQNGKQIRIAGGWFGEIIVFWSFAEEFYLRRLS